ncbi:hypothetical protein L3X38_041145 [Prunus dulcis]|uniref:Uncharacterized protein n=1 Tax=Prunus dulcis TaxID=3755 RepID=A0AAD4UUE0_PRUDU|nr:hypothetical protein L3X38_041145 [Prunus dulcis]
MESIDRSFTIRADVGFCSSHEDFIDSMKLKKLQRHNWMQEKLLLILESSDEEHMKQSPFVNNVLNLHLSTM